MWNVYIEWTYWQFILFSDRWLGRRIWEEQILKHWRYQRTTPLYEGTDSIQTPQSTGDYPMFNVRFGMFFVKFL